MVGFLSVLFLSCSLMQNFDFREYGANISVSIIIVLKGWGLDAYFFLFFFVRLLALRPLTYWLTYGAEPFLRSCQLFIHSEIPSNFKEPESSSLCSQEPSTGPYPEPDRSSPYHPMLSLLRCTSISVLFETSAHTRCTQRHIPEDGIVCSYRCENLKSYTKWKAM
jgi:hypothetical protein